MNPIIPAAIEAAKQSLRGLAWVNDGLWSWGLEYPRTGRIYDGGRCDPQESGLPSLEACQASARKAGYKIVEVGDTGHWIGAVRYHSWRKIA